MKIIKGLLISIGIGLAGFGGFVLYLILQVRGCSQ